jgi:ABC-type glycerol-3-phosphate transport system permease component
MTFLYTILDKIAKGRGIKKTMAILQLTLSVGILIAGLYLLFRTYNDVGLTAVILVYFVLMPRDSYLERKEMKKVEKQSRTASAENV